MIPRLLCSNPPALTNLHSLFSGVEIMDLMSDLGAYASLLYTAALTGAMKVVYTIVVAFALVASLHGVHTRAMIILDMQEVNTAAAQALAPARRGVSRCSSPVVAWLGIGGGA